MQRRTMGVFAGTVALVMLVGRRARRAGRRATDEAGRRLRYTRGRIRGLTYRLAGRHPAEDVSDDVLADRVRSRLGPIEKRLDTPRIHVTVVDRFAHLHGDVPSSEAHEQLMDAVLDVAGIEGVVSFLHVGLLASDARPSEGRAVRAPSAAKKAIVEAAAKAGAAVPERAARATLATFLERIPDDERRQVIGHLPEDVRAFGTEPLRAGRKVHDLRELVEAVQGTGALYGSANPTAVVEAVVAALRDLVPEEAGDIAAVLPQQLREFWREAGV